LFRHLYQLFKRYWAP